jgi:O-antigen ligase
MSKRPTVAVARERTVGAQITKDRHRWWGVFGIMIGFVLVTGLIAMQTAPKPFSIAFVVLVLTCAAAFLRPTIGIYLIVFLTLIGDIATTPWWPFTKNMSSRESIFYVADSLSINPLEVLLVVTTAAWLSRRLEDPLWRFKRGALFWPVVAFGAFVFFGLARGIGTGGDRIIGLFEARPLVYIPLVYILLTNLLTTRAQYRRLVVMALVAVSIQSIFSLLYYRGLDRSAQENLESLSEHSATIHMNAMFVFLLAVYLFKCSASLRWVATVCVIPVFYAYALSQRRAAMVALFIGVLVLVVVLYFRRRRAFWFFVPTAIMISLGYIVATWNAGGAVGLPAQAVKTVLFPDQLGADDASSDLYRKTEAFNLWFTIQQNKVAGVGFGQKFLHPLPLPDISFFEFWEYLPHNAVLWIWLKMGFLGFVSMLFLFARAVQHGTRSVLSVRLPEHAAVVSVGLSYVLMFIVFAWVDIAWDVRSTVFLAVAFALCGDFRLAADEPPARQHVAAFEMVPQ